MSLYAVLIASASMLVSVLGGWLVVTLVLRAARVPETPVQHVGGPGGVSVPVIAARDEPGSPVLRGGAWIGVLERLAVTGALLAGQPALTGAVVAIKGLGRWADLQGNPGSTERFIIGTLASLVWAGACGVIGSWFLG